MLNTSQNHAESTDFGPTSNKRWFGM